MLTVSLLRIKMVSLDAIFNLNHKLGLIMLEIRLLLYLCMYANCVNVYEQMFSTQFQMTRG